MIAAFLKTADGDFAYGPAFMSLVLVALFFDFIWILYRAIKTGCIPFGIYTTFATSKKMIWIDRIKNPVGFWSVFVFLSFGLPLCILGVYALCTGFFQRPD